MKRHTELNDKGFLHLATGRLVYSTGRVLIGLRYEPPKRDPGVYATWLQSLLLKEKNHARSD